MTSKKALRRNLSMLPPLVAPVNDLESAATTIERDRWGRPLLATPDGGRKGYTRCTTYIDVTEDKSALEKWKVRTALLGAADNPTILRAARTVSKDWRDGKVPEQSWKSRMNQLGDEALEQGGATVRAQAGTDLHALTEVIDRDGIDALPMDKMLDADYMDLSAYVRETRRVGLETAAIELFVVNDDLGVAGTLDRVYVVNGTFPHPSKPDCFVIFKNDLVVGDVKTGAVHPGKVAMQVGIYANSAIYDRATGARTELPVRKDWGVVVHLPQNTPDGECNIFLVDLALGMGGVSVASQVRAWRNTGRKAINTRLPM